MKDTKISRRAFLKSGGVAAAVAGSNIISVADSHAATPVNCTGTTLPYPEKVVGKVARMPVNQAVAFNYPDASSPCYVIRLGNAIPDGVGPNSDVVAYSAMCPHMGCPVAYDGDSRTFKCRCHFSVFDPERGGQMVCGQATEDLPRIKLTYDARTDSVTAVGADGLLYGRQSNLL